MLSKIKCACWILFLISNDVHGYKVTKSPLKPVPAIKNSPYVYRGQVFILRETDDPSTPFLAELVNGGIEMVQPSPQKANPIPLPPPINPLSHHPSLNDRMRLNDSLPDVLEDPEYFAVMITPETAALTQISRTTVVEIPLTMLLTAFAKRMPWVLVLKRKNHFEYFRNIEPALLSSQQLPMLMSQRRRSRAHSAYDRRPRLVLDSRKYALVFSQKDKEVLQTICTNVVQELTMLNAIMNQYSNSTQPIDLEQVLTEDFNEMKAKNNTKVPIPGSAHSQTISIEHIFEKN